VGAFNVLIEKLRKGKNWEVFQELLHPHPSSFPSGNLVVEIKTNCGERV
jgi:hypothetical protein